MRQKTVITKKALDRIQDSIIVDTRERRLSYNETVKKYLFGNPQYGAARVMLQRWERIYFEERAEGLMKEMQGRACAATVIRKGRPSKLDKNVEENLTAENQRLRIELNT